MDKETERRRHKRVTLVTRVTHVLSDHQQYYYSRDLSLGGIFLETKKPFPVGTRLDLDFSIPGNEKRIKVVGKVARVVLSEPDHKMPLPGMGVSFITLPEEIETELVSFLSQK